MRQEFELQAAEVIRRRSKSRDTSAESALKLKSAEKKLTELKSSMLTLGKEAIDAMLSVEAQQQEITFQKILTMVDAERSYHQNVIAILEKLHSEMILEEQMEDPILQPETPPRGESIPSHSHESVSNRSNVEDGENKSDSYFIAKVIHPFDAQADGELSLEVDDYVVVRQVSTNGWSEGECKGKAGDSGLQDIVEEVVGEVGGGRGVRVEVVDSVEVGLELVQADGFLAILTADEFGGGGWERKGWW
ncbi:SH3 domain-containing protein [Striga hermonthica]|uniref:SH3 domain-containing protein n=1 Tax=Striga hermonthica TaxID=68872 RepID=A0A9N7MNL9_STRHE|nr:SH3 domain-containing protein [Striga hermonthica]